MKHYLMQSSCTCNKQETISDVNLEVFADYGENWTNDELEATWQRAVGYAIGEQVANWYETPKSERGEKPSWYETLAKLL